MVINIKSNLSIKWDVVKHRWFRVPYTLHASELQSPKKPRATIVLIHGIGNSSRAWDGLVPLLPEEARVIVVDLLGFGKSPKPSWVKYNAKTQARSLAATLIKMKLSQQPVLVGHSLGALVAVATAKRYPFTIKHLILCSPPFYQPETLEGSILERDKMLRKIYRTATAHPETFQKLSQLAMKIGLANKSLDLSGERLDTYFATLETSIINQTSLNDIQRLRLPITVLYGMFDPMVIGSHIRSLAKAHSNISAQRLFAGHEVTGSYTNKVAEVLRKIVDSYNVQY